MVAASTPARVYRFDRFELQTAERRLLADGAALALRPLTFDVLALLVERAGHLVTKGELLQRVWGSVVVEENAVQAHVSALRKVVGPDAIKTVSGQGYRFVLDVQSLPPAWLPLPQPPTRFIGREREIADLRRELATTRLLTLTGPGGCGKTRLAGQVVGAMADVFADGVRLVELAPLADPTLVVRATARALGLDAEPGRDLVDTMVDGLGARRLLLLLDNAEHLVEACALMAEQLLQRCAGLTVLATSRERLGIAGELVFRVPPLSLPAGETAADLLASEAGRLLVDRGRGPLLHAAMNGDSAAALASICRRLDGIALAIELAAPQLQTMSPDRLRRRLDDVFGVLTGGPPELPRHHRTLRSLIDWSHDLLGTAERLVLHRASVFAGGWTAEAAEHVCGGDGVDRGQAWPLLIALADKSLVVAQTDGGETRFDMLETVRGYAQQWLRDRGEEAAVRGRHLVYFAGLADGLDPAHDDAAIQRTLQRLDGEHDNLRAALAWCEREPGRAVDGLRLAGRLNWFWQVRRHVGEGRAWLARLLAAARADEPGEAHAAALHAGGALASLDDDLVTAVALQREAIVLWRRLGDRRQLVRTLGSLGEFEQIGGDFVSARQLLEEALAIARELDDLRSVALGLRALAGVASAAGDLDGAQGLLEQALAVSRDVGAWVVGAVLQDLGAVLHARGDLPAAEATLTKALADSREFGDEEYASFTLLNLSEVAHDRGDLAAAKALLRQSLALLDRAPDTLLDRVAACAGLLAETAGPVCAARLWGCVQQHDGDRRLDPLRRRRQQRLQQAARRTLDDDATFERAWNEGRAWTLAQGLHQALEFDGGLGESAGEA